MSKGKYVPNLATLCYLTKGDKILLGRKKGGPAKGILNGFGGKVEFNDKSITDSVKREFKEETGLDLLSVVLNSVIFIHKAGNETQPEQTSFIYVYLTSAWSGEPTESKEMTVEWYDKLNVPLNEMWSGDKHWFHTAVSERKSLVHLYFPANSDEPAKVAINFVEELHEDVHKEN